MAKRKKEVEGNSGEISNEKLCAILSYFIIGIIWYFADENLKKSKFVNFHVKQGLVLLVLDIIFWFVSMIPITGWLIAPILWIVFIILLLLGIVNAANGREKELPIVGKFAKNFNI